MSHPVVAAASAYVGKRSWKQLLLDLGDVDGRAENGGKRERPNGTTRRTAAMKDFDDAQHKALEHYRWAAPMLRSLAKDSAKIWLYLPDAELANAADLLRTLAKDAAGVCRGRHIVPSKLADWRDDLPSAEL